MIPELSSNLNDPAVLISVMVGWVGVGLGTPELYSHLNDPAALIRVEGGQLGWIGGSLPTPDPKP